MPDTTLILYRESGRLGPNSSTLGPYRVGDNARFFAGLLSEPFGDGRAGTYPNPSAITISVSIGNEYLPPRRGEWALGTGAATSTDISYNATTAQVKNAISGVYGNVAVAAYGSTISQGWIITAATANTALTMTGKSLSLSPYSKVEILNLTSPGSGVTAQKIVTLRQNPVFSTTAYGNPVTLSAPTITLISTTTNAFGQSQIYELEFDSQSRKFSVGYDIYGEITGAVTSFVGGATLYTNMPFNILVDSEYLNTAFQGSNRGLLSRAFHGSMTESEASAFASGRYGSAGGSKIYSSVTLSPNDFVNRQSVVTFNSGATAYLYPSDILYNVAAAIGTESANKVRLYVGDVYRSFNTISLTPKIRLVNTNMPKGPLDLGVITFSGAHLDELFVEAKRNEITLTLEVSLVEASRQQSLLQTPVRIERTVA